MEGNVYACVCMGVCVLIVHEVGRGVVGEGWARWKERVTNK